MKWGTCKNKNKNQTSNFRNLPITIGCRTVILVWIIQREKRKAFFTNVINMQFALPTHFLYFAVSKSSEGFVFRTSGFDQIYHIFSSFAGDTMSWNVRQNSHASFLLVRERTSKWTAVIGTLVFIGCVIIIAIAVTVWLDFTAAYNILERMAIITVQVRIFTVIQEWRFSQWFRLNISLQRFCIIYMGTFGFSTDAWCTRLNRCSECTCSCCLFVVS